MPTLGEELKKRREARSISLNDIAESTKISTRYLKAIEAGNYSVLPGGIFTRSFIRAYAREVGMGEEEAVGLYHQQIAPPSPEQPAQVGKGQAKGPGPERPVAAAVQAAESGPRPSAQKVSRTRRQEPVAYRSSPTRTSWSTVVIFAGVVIFLLLVIVVLVRSLNSGQNEKSTNTTAVAQKNDAGKPTPPTPSGSGQTGQTPPVQSTGDTSKPPAGDAPVQNVPTDALAVKIEASAGDSWLRYQVDDAKPGNILLKQGDTQDLPPAQKQIKLNLGNRLALKLKINNREATFPANTPKFSAQVVISRDNLQTFFQ